MAIRRRGARGRVDLYREPLTAGDQRRFFPDVKFPEIPSVGATIRRRDEAELEITKVEFRYPDGFRRSPCVLVYARPVVAQPSDEAAAPELRCPECGTGLPDLADWTDTAQMSYGVACLGCKLFIQFGRDGEIASMPLALAPFPMRHRKIPAYRNAVGWVGQ